MARSDVGLEEALRTVLGALRPLPPVEVAVHEAAGLVPACDLRARVDCPAADLAARDGYAVHSADLEGAGPERPIRLSLVGRATAGQVGGRAVEPGSCVRVLTGALLPARADAVLAGEFATEENEWVLCRADAGPGRNVLARGSDASTGALLAPRGRVLAPAAAGLLAAGGVATLHVHPRPEVAVVATGDELALPGAALGPGQLFASNAVTLVSWLARFGMRSRYSLAPDRPEAIAAALEQALDSADALLTSGGAWKSERDHMAGVLALLGVEPLFQRVRLGPGKALLFGLKGGKPIFCLAGGPASNEIGFLQVALPGLLRLAGRESPPFPRLAARLTARLGGEGTWTQFFQVRLETTEGLPLAIPLKGGSRLQALADADGLVRVREGVERLEAGQEVEVELLHPGLAGLAAPGPRPLPPVFCVVGRTRAGKTRLIERLVPALQALGLQVGTIKHDAHRFELDRPGKDSDRHKKAGALVTVISSPAAIGMVRDAGCDTPIAVLRERYLHDVDLVLAEGYAREAWPKVEVHRAELGGLLASPDQGLVAVLSEEPVEAGVPRFEWTRVGDLAAFLAGLSRSPGGSGE